MAARRNRNVPKLGDEYRGAGNTEDAFGENEIPFDQGSLAQMHAVAASGLNPSSALHLLARLIAEVPSASKQTMDRIKTVDKLISTARSVMETKLKNEEVAALMARVDELETRIERLAAQSPGRTHEPTEVWNRPDD